MKKIIIFLAVYFLFQNLPSYSFSFDGIYDTEMVVYSPSAHMWSQSCTGKNDVLFIKNVSSESKNYSYYVSTCLETSLNSDFEFIHNGKLIGVDNENLKYYEIVYKNGELIQEILSCAQVQEIFSDVDVINISDFSRGIYTIINHSDSKMILLYNDLEENFNKYLIKPETSIVCRDIKGLIKLPRRGKITFSHICDNNKNKYVIKVR